MKCHGQCFLETNLEVADDTSSEKNTPPIEKQTIDFLVFLMSENLYAFPNLALLRTGTPCYLPGISSGHRPVLFHPPDIQSQDLRPMIYT